ncbi:hypothetical protein Gasu2_40200 [Galdieria sulphuraria]|nr:hypothetical protein Gasu2_40200 [Galdieria sulphuraria]
MRYPTKDRALDPMTIVPPPSWELSKILSTLTSLLSFCPHSSSFKLRALVDAKDEDNISSLQGQTFLKYFTNNLSGFKTLVLLPVCRKYLNNQ